MESVLQPQTIITLLLTCIASMSAVIAVLWKHEKAKDKRLMDMYNNHAVEYKEIAKEGIIAQQKMVNSSEKLHESVERLTQAMKENNDKLTSVMFRAIENK